MVAYQCAFNEDVHLTALNNVLVTLPAKKRIVIKILDDDIENDVSLSEKQEAFEALKGIIPVDFKFTLEEIRDERIRKKGLYE